MKRKIQIIRVVLALGLVGGAYDIVCAADPAPALTTVPAVIPAPATGTTHAVGAPAGEWVKTEIYFGRDLPGGQEISRWAWANFMDKEITLRFPDGLTVYEAYGQMQHVDGRIEKQSTWVVAIVHAKDPAIDTKILEIVDAFRKQFRRAQVVQLSAPVISARFYAD